MKKLTSLLILLVVILVSCEKERLTVDNNLGNVPKIKHDSYVLVHSRLNQEGVPELAVAKNGVVQNELVGRLFCKEIYYDLVAGQTIVSGNIIVANDLDNLYITYKSSNGWKIKEIHLYVGPENEIPVNPANIPVPGQFPIKESFDPPVEVVTYEIPLSELNGKCPVILAHAVVINGNQEETAWGKGERSFEEMFQIKRWGWVIGEFCPEECKGKDLVIGLKSYVVDPKVYDPKTDIHLWWVVTKGEGSITNCLSLGFDSFNTNQSGSSVFDLIKWGALEDKKGTMTVFTTVESGVKYLNVVIKLNDEAFAFSHSFLYVGSKDGLANYYYVYESKDCFKFYEWFYKNDEILNTKTYKIPLEEII